MVEVLKFGNKGCFKILLFCQSRKESENVYRAAKNIEGVEIVSANSLKPTESWTTKDYYDEGSCQYY